LDVSVTGQVNEMMILKLIKAAGCDNLTLEHVAFSHMQTV